MPEHVRLVRVPEDVMESISPMAAPQGAVFLCRMPEKTAFTPRRGMLLLDGIQDPGNLGTILRTADALDVPVVLSDGCADPYGEKTVRASMGAIFRTQPVQASRAEILSQCRAAGIPLAVTALTADARDIREAVLSEMAVVIGSEGRGVCADFLEMADRRLIIPMNPRCESLNAAIAATVLLWEAARND